MTRRKSNRRKPQPAPVPQTEGGLTARSHGDASPEPSVGAPFVNVVINDNSDGVGFRYERQAPGKVL